MGLLNRRRDLVDGVPNELDGARSELERLTAELEQVRVRLDRAQTALDGLPVGVVLVDAAGGVISRNRSAHVGRGHSDVLVQEAIDRHVQQALLGRESMSTVELFGPPRRVIQVKAVANGGGALVVIEDVSERARLDAVRTDFVANISHELKTPVGALAVLAEAISEEDDLEVVRRLAGKMVDEAHRAATSIDDLLELSRIELGGRAVRDPVGLADVLRSAVIRSLAAAEQRSIRIDLTEPTEPITVFGDRRQLVSALSNLIDNAIKYSEAESEIWVSAHIDDRFVGIRVEDHGVGIPAKDLDRIFERFYRVDRARSRDTGGTGLGLAIVRHVANNHEGDVLVRSTEGEGSVFTLRIPCATGSGS